MINTCLNQSSFNHPYIYIHIHSNIVSLMVNSISMPSMPMCAYIHNRSYQTQRPHPVQTGDDEWYQDPKQWMSIPPKQHR